ncbi:hypothetical protein EDC01DRAFT_448121 [Geopyxis carbonaria]|nr:hypothetical protein EDC01DRAFT_448121 [Geopyxis carbonaria]
MKASLEYKSPLSWSDPSFNILSYDIAILPGGHDKPIRQYLESQSLHRHISKFLPYTKRGPKNSSAPKVLGAICHGPLVLAFGKNDETGESLIHGLESATLPKWLEMTAWVVSQAWALGNYYRTYGTRNWCEEQIQKAGAVFRRGPMNMGPFVHVDPNYRYISATLPR